MTNKAAQPVISRNADEQYSHTALDEVPFAALFAAAHHPWLVALTVILCTAVAVAAALLMTPVYRVEVLMAPADDDQPGIGGLTDMMGQFGGLASLAGVQIGGSNVAHKAIATLKSRAFTETFIKEENLLPVLFSSDWDEERNEWKVDDPDDVPTLWDGYKLFEEEIRSVTRDLESGLVTLAIEWTDSAEAARWANKMVTQLNTQMRTRAIEKSQKTIDYLQTELRQTSIVELQQAIYRLVEVQIKRIAIANVSEDYSFWIIDPAMVPDPDEHVRPQRLVMVVGGFVAGLFLAIAMASIVDFRRRPRANEGPGD